MSTRTTKFLQELEILLKKHRVAICADHPKEGYSTVFFQVFDRREGSRHKVEKVRVNRTHVTSSDIKDMLHEEAMDKMK